MITLTLRQALAKQAEQVAYYAERFPGGAVALAAALAEITNTAGHDLDAPMPSWEVNKLVPRGSRVESIVNEAKEAKAASFDAQRFLDHIILQLRQIGVDLTTWTNEARKAQRMEGNPRECYLIEFYGFTPDYPKQGDKQPAYKVKGYAYPESREFYLQIGSKDDWNSMLWPSCNGMTPAEKALRDSGLTGYDMAEWQVIAE